MPEPSEELQSEVEGLLDFNETPAPPAEEPAPVAEPAPEPEAEPEVEAPAPKEPEAPAPVEAAPEVPAPAPPDAAAEELRATRRQLEELQSRFDELATTPPPVVETKPEDPFAGVPAYDYNVPDQLLELLQSDDTANVKKAVAAIMQGVSRSVHAVVRQEFSDKLQKFVPETVDSRVQQFRTQDEIRQDFYSKYPKLNVPAIRKMVAEASVALVQRFPSKFPAYGPDLREAVVEHLKTILAPTFFESEAAVAPKPPVRNAPPPLRKPGVRPAAPAPVGDVEKDILETLELI